MRICIASSFPENGNRNLTIVADLADGFREIVGEENLYELPYRGLASQIARLRPDLVVMVGSALQACADYRDIARACRNANTVFAFWTVEDPYEFDMNFKFTDFADIVFSNDAWASRFYDHPQVHHLPTASSARRRRSLEAYRDRTLDVFFCGVGFANRQVFVNEALPILERRRTLIQGANWLPHAGGMVTNRRLSDAAITEFYAASRCVLNMGRSFAYANDRRSLQAVTPGPRTFDAAMVGCVQMYYQPSECLKDYFEIGKEIITFDSLDEFEVKLEAVLSDPDAACRIAEASQKRAMADHTYTARAKAMLKHVTALG